MNKLYKNLGEDCENEHIWIEDKHRKTELQVTSEVCINPANFSNEDGEAQEEYVWCPFYVVVV